MTDPNTHDSDDKFLDELYSLTKNEASPEVLDNKILMAAKAQTEKQYSTVYRWQRLASVAALMVFSIYIFFDVSEQKSSLTESDMVAPSSRMQMAPKADFQADVEEKMPEDAVLEERVSEESAVQAPSPVPMFEVPASSIVKEAAQTEAKRESMKALKRENNFKKKAFEMRAKEEAIAEQNDVRADKLDEQLQQNSTHRKTAQVLVMEIRLMISKFRPEKARELYERLINEYEDYDVPEDIQLYMKALEKRIKTQ